MTRLKTYICALNPIVKRKNALYGALQNVIIPGVYSWDYPSHLYKIPPKENLYPTTPLHQTDHRLT